MAITIMRKGDILLGDITNNAQRNVCVPLKELWSRLTGSLGCVGCDDNNL
ncbi:MAG TPA: hypothetical protein PKK52_02130 [Syntrophorhabdus sp.]|nr:hypothetical protein [Syntrophorhabdus sp.]HNY69356.1 hypothetical protein [Syntrophorhabdus sp.]HQB34769.1 hypothetical protein [Syntrophorhabdus sp.]HQH82182.1 hypothetical protein [Syntrophorhabdus sp.]